MLSLSKNDIPPHLLKYFRPRHVVKPKDDTDAPSAVVAALRDDGWWLRSRMPYLKRNAMPESVRDRPSSAVEYVFLLTKQSRYFWDHEAVKRPNARLWDPGVNGAVGRNAGHGSWGQSGVGKPGPDPAGRNFRNADLWFDSRAPGFWDDDDGPAGLLLDEAGDPLALEVNPTPYPGQHFAVFSPKLVEPLIRAATSEKGVCPACGAPWRRVVERLADERRPYATVGTPRRTPAGGAQSTVNKVLRADGRGGDLATQRVETVGWAPQCACSAGPPVPATVMDPFLGAGTTLMVADRLGRNGIGVELSEPYARQAFARIQADSPMFAAVEVDP